MLNLASTFGSCVNELWSSNSQSIIKLHKRAGLRFLGLARPSLKSKTTCLEQFLPLVEAAEVKKKGLNQPHKPQDTGIIYYHFITQWKRGSNPLMLKQKIMSMQSQLVSSWKYVYIFFVTCKCEEWGENSLRIKDARWNNMEYWLLISSGLCAGTSPHRNHWCGVIVYQWCCDQF